MISGNRLKRIAYALILAGVALMMYLRHREIEETGSMRWFDRPLVFVTSPIARGLRAIEDSLHHVFSRYFFLVGVERENEALKRDLDDSRSHDMLFEAEAKENERLRGLLDLKKRIPGDWIAARVVSTPPISPYRVITIDKGLDDGVTRRAAVIAADGLVGQVSRVFGHTSQVLLITDPTSAVDGRIEETQS